MVRSTATLLLLLLTGCLTSRASDAAARRAAGPTEALRYPRAPVEAIVTPGERESEGYRTSTVTFAAYDPSDLFNPRVVMVLRQPIIRSARLIVILPILGGDYGASDLFARHFAEAGFNTLRFERKDRVFEPGLGFDHVARMMVRGAIDVQRGIDWAEDRGLTRRGVGIMGISMGSFVATIVAASDPRIRASALALGGADLVQVLHAARGEEEIEGFLSALEARGLSSEEINRTARQHLGPLDPVVFAPAIDPRTSLLIHARFDGVVPYARGTELWEAAGRPARITLLTGHYTAWFAVPYLLSATLTHFQRSLQNSNTN